MKREEERREADESTRMAAEEQRQKDVCQAQKEEEERQRMAEEQRREEAGELLVFSASLTWIARNDCDKSSKEKLKRSCGWPRKSNCCVNVCRQKKHGDGWRRGADGGSPCVFGVQHARRFAWFCWFSTRYITAVCEIVPSLCRDRLRRR